MDKVGLEGGVNLVVPFGAYHFTMQSKANNMMPHQTQWGKKEGFGKGGFEGDVGSFMEELDIDYESRR